MAGEALQSFSTLLEGIPGWIADLEGIVKTSAERQKQYLTENQPAGDELPLALRRKVSKSSSLRSYRSQDAKEKASTPGPLKSEPTVTKEQGPHMTESDALRLAQRKRKTASACSGRQSGPYKYRSRSMVVVYYDGDVQKRFETIVRAIGTSRNTLRKGKMSAKVEAIARSGSSSSSDGSNEEAAAIIRKMGYTPTRLRQQGGAANRNDGSEAFDKADGFLEKAQALCERAAHQVLRDGDCALEIRNAKEHFTDVKKVCEAALPELQRKADKALERQRRSEERRKEEEAEAEEHEKKDLVSSPDTSDEKIAVDPFNSPGTLEVDIEADDDDGGDDEDEQLNAIQLGKFRMRSTRMMTPQGRVAA